MGLGYRTRGFFARRFRISTDRLQRCEMSLSRRRLFPTYLHPTAYLTGSGRVELAWVGQFARLYVQIAGIS